MKHLLFLLPALLLASPGGVAQEGASTTASQTPPLVEVDAATKARAVTVLASVTKRLKDVEVMRSAYVQERTSPLLIEPLVSKGVLFQRTQPACLLFRVTTPNPAQIRVDESTYQVYRPDEGTAERFIFEGAHAGRALLEAFRPEVKALFEAFALVGFEREALAEEKDALAVLTLRPRDEEARKRVDNVVLKIDVKKALPSAVTYVDHEGYEVTLRLSEIELDPKLEGVEDVFGTELPAGVRVLVHRIGGD